jgi:hypothetical protein
MSSRKPLRRINSDRGEDDYLSKRNFLKSYMRLPLPQLACTRRLGEGRAWVHTCRPYTGCMYLCGSLKKIQSRKETDITGMEDWNLCYLKILQKL